MLLREEGIGREDGSDGRADEGEKRGKGMLLKREIK